LPSKQTTIFTQAAEGRFSGEHQKSPIRSLMEARLATDGYIINMIAEACNFEARLVQEV
jgi:hypothetical protein